MSRAKRESKVIDRIMLLVFTLTVYYIWHFFLGEESAYGFPFAVLFVVWVNRITTKRFNKGFEFETVIAEIFKTPGTFALIFLLVGLSYLII